MHDINQALAHRRRLASDADDHLHDLDRWSPRIANRVADEEGIVLEEDHWQVIYCLRERFRSQGPDWTAREMTRVLEAEFADVGGRRYLYSLFPRGPLLQACRLAGLPLPHGTISASFGSVH